MEDIQSEGISRAEKINALIKVAKFKPAFTLSIILFGVAAAVLEGVGLSFILPIVDLVQASDPTAEAEGLLAVFVDLYNIFNIPFRLSYVIAGVSIVMVVRYTTSFIVAWLREALRTYYIQDLQEEAFSNAMHASISYFDSQGSDDILNAIVTQTYYAGRVIQRAVQLLEQFLLAGMYFTIALVISPRLTLFTGISLGVFTMVIRKVIDSGYELGDDVADANEQRQEAVQSGTKGIRDIRAFGMGDELYKKFRTAINKYTTSRIRLRRNEAAITKFYNLGVAVSVFILIFLAIEYADLSLGALGLFLFAIFRLGPKASNVNKYFYQVENDLPHLVRTVEFINELERNQEQSGGDTPVPENIQSIAFSDVWFSYSNDPVLKGLKMHIDKGEFVGIVGESGAGKSTIVSLLMRYYDVDNGSICINDIDISEIDVSEWRNRVAIVRQDPYIFDQTLRYNLTIGNRNVDEGQLDDVCKISKVDEFIEDLDDGYDTDLGDEGVRLSGGQKQRVAIARALIKDANILILDEATSNLDSQLEAQVQEAIENMQEDYTIIAIAHRLSTVSSADMIYTVENGQVLERGTHDELISKGGKYSELYSIQNRN